MTKKHYTALEYVLLGLIPYSRPNLKLVFLPHRFFQELSRISNYKHRSLQTALARAQQKGYVRRSKGIPTLTTKGREKIRLHQAPKLKNQDMLMVIFDIPEELSAQRRRFRTVLRNFNFHQTQKSVWLADADYTQDVKQAVEELRLSNYVQIFECSRIKPS